ncbi:hypothetical protein BDZ91DRAFT_35672 [Kalaharituber pfeilii]|nr:hypothetical protein BDZ91DRAFT_35672 [Kalaharituber pfeilii]
MMTKENLPFYNNFWQVFTNPSKLCLTPYIYFHAILITLSEYTYLRFPRNVPTFFLQNKTLYNHEKNPIIGGYLSITINVVVYTLYSFPKFAKFHKFYFERLDTKFEFLTQDELETITNKKKKKGAS